MIRFRTGFAPGTIDRLAARMGIEADRRAEQVARRGAELMLVEARRSAVDERQDYQKVGKVKPDPRRSYADLMASGVERTDEGWRAYLKIVDDATPEEVAKFAAIERGSKPHQIPKGRLKKQAMTGWEATYDGPRRKVGEQVFTPTPFTHPGTEAKHTLRRARDRVYQRIRRGTV